MFYSAQILAKKGPLGIVWLAAHMDNRLKKTNVFEANIVGSVDSIMNPEAPLALRLSGQLLLGVVNIYKKKIVYLFEDCNDALSKMQQAFKPANVTLPGDGRAAHMHITLPDDFNFGHMDMFDEEDLDHGTFDLSQSLKLAVNSKDSLYLADDATAIFKTPVSYRDEQFEIDGDEVERHLSLDPPEKLREAVAPTAQRLFQTGLASPGFRKGDEIMPDVNMDDDDIFGALDAPPSAPPSSHHDSEHGILTPHNDDIDTGPIAYPELELQNVQAVREDASKTPKPSRLRAGEKRKRVAQDVDAEGNPDTVLPNSTIRALLADRQPLLKEARKIHSAEAVAHLPRSKFHVMQYTKDASNDWTAWPGISQEIAPALYSLYQSTLSYTVTTGKSRQRTKKTDQGVTAAEEEQTDVDGAAQEQAANLPAAPIEPGQELDHAEELYQEGGADLGLQDGPEGYGGEGSEVQHDHDEALLSENPPLSPEAMGHMTSPQASGSQLPSGKGTSSRKRLPSLEESEGREEIADAAEAAPDSFTARTQQVLKNVKARLAGKKDGKKQRLSGAAAKGVAFQELHANGSRTEAARLFFELLVLQARNKVVLAQEEPFATINVALQ